MEDDHSGISEETTDSLRKRIVETESEEENMIIEPKDRFWNDHVPKITQGLKN